MIFVPILFPNSHFFLCVEMLHAYVGSSWHLQENSSLNSMKLSHNKFKSKSDKNTWRLGNAKKSVKFSCSFLFLFSSYILDSI